MSVKRPLQKSPTATKDSPPNQKLKLDPDVMAPPDDLDPLTIKNLREALVSALSNPGVAEALGAIIAIVLNQTLENQRAELAKKDSEIAELKGEVSDLKGEISTLKGDMDGIKAQFCSIKYEVDNLEQYERRCNLRFTTEIVETEDEDTDAIIADLANSVGITLHRTDISRSHRIGKKGDSPRPIIARFISYRCRESIYDKRKVAENFYISEDLTKLRNTLYFKARELKRSGKFKHVWCRDGIIKIRLHDDNVRTVTTYSDLEKAIVLAT